MTWVSNMELSDVVIDHIRQMQTELRDATGIDYRITVIARAPASTKHADDVVLTSDDFQQALAALRHAAALCDTSVPTGVPGTPGPVEATGVDTPGWPAMPTAAPIEPDPRGGFLT